MIGYPTNRLLMVVDEPESAQRAVEALTDAGFGPDRVATLSGDGGVDELRRLGGAGGLLGRLVRMFQFMSMDQMPDFVMYEAALRDGRAVLAVRPKDRTDMLAARDVIAGGGGHFANWFGRFSTEELSRWRGPQPQVPTYFRR